MEGKFARKAFVLGQVFFAFFGFSLQAIAADSSSCAQSYASSSRASSAQGRAINPIPGDHSRPLADLTPGDLCTNPVREFHGGNICKRKVRSEVRDAVLRNYNQRRGPYINDLNRAEFKVDHYIPLCLGGSNRKANLWPQHRSSFRITDPIEAALCEKVREGKITRNKAIEIIKAVKNDVSLEAQSWNEINSLR